MVIDLFILTKPFYVPKDAYAVMPLAKTVAICTERGVVIANLSRCALQNRVLLQFS